MVNEVEVKGKNLEEALQLAQNQLNTTRDNITYEIVEESNKTLFSILSPKFVIIKAKKINEELVENSENIKQEKYILTEEDKAKAEKIAKEFLDDLFKTLKLDNDYIIEIKENIIYINISSSEAKVLIGYRGEVLEALQTVLSTVVNNKMGNNIKIQIDIENYREKRKQILTELANKVAKSVLRTGKSISLEPMVAYERKIIHLALQENNQVETISMGEEPYRKVVIKLKQ